LEDIYRFGFGYADIDLTEVFLTKLTLEEFPEKAHDLKRAEL